MGKKEKNQNLHDQVQQERKIQREESAAEERKNTSQQESSQEKEAEAKKKKKRKIAVLAGCCGVLAVASVCLITALGHPANDSQKATAVSVQSVSESSDEKAEIAEVTVTKVPERTDKKQEENVNTKKGEEKKDQDKETEIKTENKTETKSSVSSEERQEQQADTESVTTEPANTHAEQRNPEGTALPAVNQTDSVVSEPSATMEPSSAQAVQESIPQETTTEITPEPTPLPHVHSWVTKFRTVHHDAVTEEVKVVDQPAYTEPVYEEQPVYETIAVYVCDVCGEDFENVGEHSETHIDWETFTNPFHYHVDFRQGVQIGTEMVQTGSVTYPEKSHVETKVISAAYDEQVPDGYVCTGCGAVK